MFVLLFPGKSTHHASQGMAFCRRFVRMGGAHVHLREVAFSERGIPRSPVRSPTRSIHHSGIHHLYDSPAIRPRQPQRTPVPKSKGWRRPFSALGETSPHAKPLVEALRIARAKSAVLPLQQRIQSCKSYVERAKQRVVRAEAVITRAVEQKAICEGEVTEGEKRLQQLLMEDASSAPPVPACSPQVAELQRQIDDLKEREMWKIARKQGGWCADGPPSTKEIPPIPVSVQELGGWISERNCDLTLWNLGTPAQLPRSVHC